MPLTFDPEYFSLVEDDTLDIEIFGAAEDTVFTVTPYDLEGNVVAFSQEGETPTGYGQMEVVGNILEYTPDDIEEITEFTLMIVADDTELADLGLDTLDSGIYRVIPLATYAGVIKDADTDAPVDGALVELIAPRRIAIRFLMVKKWCCAISIQI